MNSRQIQGTTARNLRRRHARWVAVVVAAFAVGSVALANISVGSPASETASRSGLPIATSDSAAKSDANSYMQSMIAQEEANPHTKPSPQQGLQMAEAANEVVGSDAAGTEAAPSSGIDLNMHEGPFPASSFAVEDLYQGPAQGTWELVYVGGVPDLASGVVTQGAVRIYSEPHGNGSMTLVGTFYAPSGTAGLKAVSVSGSNLTLQTGAGSALIFDLDTDQFN